MLNDYEREFDESQYRRRFDRYSSDYEARDRLVKKYAWAIPNQEALEAIAALGPIVEIGAGRGYWASLLHEMGVDIIAYDLNPPDIAKNHYCVAGDDEGDFIVPYHQVQASNELVAAEHPDRALLVIWPCYDKRWGYEAVAAYHKAGGQTVLFVGESQGGCTADNTFFDYLDHHAVEVVIDEDYSTTCKRIDIPSWSGIHDSMHIYRLKEFTDSFVELQKCPDCYDYHPKHEAQLVSAFKGWETYEHEQHKKRYPVEGRQEYCLECYEEWIIQHMLPADCGGT